MIRKIIVLLFTFIIYSQAIAQEKQTLAVIDLQGLEGVSQGEAKIITNRLSAELFDTDKFIIVERDRMDEILKEQGFQMSGCTSDECRVEAGRLLGVKLIVTG